MTWAASNVPYTPTAVGVPNLCGTAVLFHLAPTGVHQVQRRAQAAGINAGALEIDCPDGHANGTAGGSQLTYDPATDRYTSVWKTAKTWSDHCRQLTLGLTDGTEHQANFLLK